jgi:hypothetical protein
MNTIDTSTFALALLIQADPVKECIKHPANHERLVAIACDVAETFCKEAVARGWVIPLEEAEKLQEASRKEWEDKYDNFRKALRGEYVEPEKPKH